MEWRVPSNREESWTNEKHVQFLNSVEAWFVRTMLENDGGHNLLRLDRDLPDSSESTLDCSKVNSVQTRRKHAANSADFIGTPGSKMKGRPDKRSRRPPPPQPSQPHDSSSQDQVVPQMEARTEDKHEKDPPNVPTFIHGTG